MARERVGFAIIVNPPAPRIDDLQPELKDVVGRTLTFLRRVQAPPSPTHAVPAAQSRRRHLPLGALVVQLNDAHHWTRERIAAGLPTPTCRKTNHTPITDGSLPLTAIPRDARPILVAQRGQARRRPRLGSEGSHAAAAASKTPSA
jgi:hypothetical protein